MHGFLYENSSISTISHLFWWFHTFFHTFFKNTFHNIIRSRNIYGLHRFYIRNSSKLAISHLFYRFNTFFYTFFNFIFTLFVPLIHTNLIKEIVLIAKSVLKLCLGTNFVTQSSSSSIDRGRLHRVHNTAPNIPIQHYCSQVLSSDACIPRDNVKEL